MATFLQVVVLLVLLSAVAVAYVAGVHRLGAWIVRHLPARYVRILSKRLWRTEYDKARDYDRIALEAEDKLNKRAARG